MASKYYGCDKGAQTNADVTIGDASGTLGIEVQVDLTKVDNTKQVLLALETIRQAIISDSSLPS